MSDLLDNELVRKYFGVDPCDHASFETDRWVACRRCVSLNVITAMEQPIKRGERYLILENAPGYFVVCEVTADRDQFPEYPLHCHALRLPDRFQQTVVCEVCQGTGKLEGVEKVQAKEHVHCFQCECGDWFTPKSASPATAPKCGCPDIDWHASHSECKPTPVSPKAQVISEVEEKIQELSQNWQSTCAPSDYYVKALRALVNLAVSEARK